MNFGAQFRRGDNGLMVGTVHEDGFFHNAGILEGDRIVTIDGHKVATEDEFRRFVRAGHGRVPLVVVRNGERREIIVNLDDLQGQRETARAGSDRENRAALGIWFYALPEGAQVVHVVPGSPAERAGVRIGDWIAKLNGTPCNDWRAVQRDVNQAEPNRTADLEVNRNGQTMRMQARLGAYDEVFANADDWQTIRSRSQEYQIPRKVRPDSSRPDGVRPDGGRADNPLLTGEGSSDRNSAGSAGRPSSAENQGNRQDLERRVRQLEQEVRRLREEIQRGNSTNAAPDRADSGRSPSPPNRQSTDNR